MRRPTFGSKEHFSCENCGIVPGRLGIESSGKATFPHVDTVRHAEGFVDAFLHGDVASAQPHSHSSPLFLAEMRKLSHALSFSLNPVQTGHAHSFLCTSLIHEQMHFWIESTEIGSPFRALTNSW